MPDGYLIGPFASAVAGGLTRADVRQIVDRANARANVTRAMIRLPLTLPTSMVIAVTDRTGRVLAAYRMADATIFSFDVATSKARNSYYFSTRRATTSSGTTSIANPSTTTPGHRILRPVRGGRSPIAP